jgi:hypothetical protein
MQHTDIGRNLSSFYETAFNTGMSAMNCIQDYTEKMVNLSIEQSPWIPEDSRKLISSWVKAYRKGYDDFKVTAVASTEQFKHLNSLLNMGCIGGSFTDAVTEQFKHFNPLFNIENIGESIAKTVKGEK